MITPELKDEVLKVLCDNCTPEQICKFRPEETGIDITLDDLNAILLHFERRGFISDLNSRRVIIHLCLTVEAIDFLRLGGFVMSEIIALQTLQKLELEIKALQKSFPEKAQTFSTILANLAVITAIFLPK